MKKTNTTKNRKVNQMKPAEAKTRLSALEFKGQGSSIYAGHLKERAGN